MKKSELRQIIREEIRRVMAEDIHDWPSELFPTDAQQQKALKKLQAAGIKAKEYRSGGNAAVAIPPSQYVKAMKILGRPVSKNWSWD